MSAVQERDAPSLKAGRSPALDSAPREGHWSRPSVVALLWLTAAAAAAIALWPLLSEFGARLWRSEQYRFAPLLIAGATAVGAQRFRHTRGERRPGRLWMRGVLWGGVLVLAAIALFTTSPFLAAVTIYAAVPAAAYEAGGRMLTRRLLPVWAVAWVAVPPPLGLDRSLVTGLARVATRWASTGLDLAGLRHLPDGVTIRVPGKAYFVDEACSGVNSFYAVLAFAGLYAVATGRGFGRAMCLLAAAVFWVVLGNAVRIWAVVVLSSRYDLPVVEGFWHDMLGLFVFLIVAGLVASSDRMLLFLLPQRREGWASALLKKLPVLQRSRGPEMASLPPKRATTAVLPAVLAASFGVMAVASAAMPEFQPETGQSEVLSPAAWKPLDEGSLPQSWGGWRRVGFEAIHREAGDVAGELSKVWRYQKGRLVAAVSMDGPYDGWHDLSWCYEGLGYDVETLGDVRAAEEVRSELRLTNGAGRNGVVFFSAYTESGQPVAPSRASRRGPLMRRLVWAFERRLGRDAARDGGRVFQVQVFAESGLGFTAEERQDLEALFGEMRHRLAGATASGAEDST